MIKNLTLILILATVVFSCGKQVKQQENNDESVKKETTAKQQNENNEWLAVSSAVAKIDSYDDGRILESGQGYPGQSRYPGGEVYRVQDLCLPSGH